MATSPMSEVLQHLRWTVLLRDGAGMTDGELLECFISRRDDAALAVLVRRHGPMVWGVCRRILASHHDAEDAFQATFLVLVRRAGSVMPREMVGNWLYGVAQQTAIHARGTAARRRTRERHVSHIPEPMALEQEAQHDLRAVLDEELTRLPNRYRAAIVLCDLEGKTRRDVAQQLGIPEGTLSGWLTRGRAMLAKRLVRHGLALSATALGEALAQNALSAEVPIWVMSTTINGASLVAARQAAAINAVSAKVSALTEGVIKTMILAKVKIAAALLLMSSASLGATGLLYCLRPDERAARPVLPALARMDQRSTANDVQKPSPARFPTRPDQRQLPFTVAPETTYVTGPLDSEGYVDYETALNEKLSKDTDPEKNANVLLWEALGPKPKGFPMPAEFFRWLKVPAPLEGSEVFIDLTRYAEEVLKLHSNEQTDELRKERSVAAQRPWVEKDYPRIAAWLKANAQPLAVSIEATRRPDYHNPLVSNKEGEEGWYELIGSLLPGAVKCNRELAPALAARAMLRVGEGKFDESWQDVLACHRLGRLLARGADHDEFLLGVAIDELASQAGLALLDRATPTAEQVRTWLHDLQNLSAIPPVADKVDLGMRFTFLNTVMLTRRSPIKTLRLIEFLEGGRKPQPEAENADAQAGAISLDWNAILRSGNAWYDRVVAALRIADRAAREAEFNRIQEETKVREKDAGTPAEVSQALRERKASSQDLTKKLGDVLIGFTLPNIRRMQTLADRNEQVHRNLHLALALAAYHHEQGCYPQQLNRLAPQYLEEVPNDLFSGKVLLYYPSDKGYLLYSVGRNGVDDGGHASDDTPPGDDLRVRIPLPEFQRK
jgi:RNA polymerase sigma factor (sigma-70 family)